MSPTAWGAIAALTVFALTATFYAGYLTHRVKTMEDWRLEMRSDMLQLRAGLHRIEVVLGVQEE